MQTLSFPETGERFQVTEVMQRSNDIMVMKVINKNKTEFLCKAFNKTKLEQTNSYDNFVKRLTIIKQLNHPNIPRVISIQEFGNYIFIFFEAIHFVTAQEYLCSNGNMTPEEILSILTQLLSVIKFTHNLGLYHGFITLDNIMFDKDMVPQLANFHLGANINQTAFESISEYVNYTTPEELKGSSVDYFATDIWRLGVCVYTLLTGSFPFSDTNRAKLCQSIMKNEPDFKNIPPTISGRIRLMLMKDPKERPSASQLLSQNIDHRIVSVGLKQATTTAGHLLRSIQSQYKISEITKATTVNFRHCMHPTYCDLPKIEPK
ncbi:CAMK family protein kinase [Trichomonas vaginalis G3]|uniref:CAMK family protein kinase n=1 Tax=Trichomonas vaginalis (strain ATCC PRA-98 / G3) TaxID=412133 RepID=A2G589_TRIV3|nr:protein serine/threonine kinase protein [Trichomonas vaginalis G3]EAX87681.1 CAMK family protein kinase [Trichomonas vaginalis G3]KAI5520395.1 protein serine/threonine kinase protein [Trichomonas vaginalis G3]|eukprot:XP_001300611.1 CAMK family protein kinase [Trichomonas vaginalis G3]